MADVLTKTPLSPSSVLAPSLFQQAPMAAPAITVPVAAPADVKQTTVRAASGGADAGSNMFLDRNNQWVKQDASAPYNTQLEPHEEISFRQWVAANKVPFDPNAAVSDYDMRGFYKALVAGDEKAKSAIDTNDSRIHYPDFWKTPYHETFSAESQWADPAKAPSWNEKDQLVMPDGTVVYDDRAPKKKEQ